jgi:hypothetical protein
MPVDLNKIYRALTPIVFAAAVCLSLNTSNAVAQDEKLFSVTVKEGQTIRDIAEEYLGDPNLWDEVIHYSDLSSVTDVKPGVELKIPLNKVTRANRALVQSLEVIQTATQQGAKVFAPDLIGQAIALRDDALEQRKIREWDRCTELATSAHGVAEEALAVSLAQRDAAAEAVLSDRSGAVQARKPDDLLWNEVHLRSILVEQEKVRTLSRATAQITFRDESRLRMNENSQAIIQRMRVDPLDRKVEAKVTLVSGDLYALLSGKSERKSFELEVSGVETEIESANFWASKDENSAKFANFDERTLDVTSAGETVTLGKNEGTLVKNREKPGGVVTLLPSPPLLAPADDELAYRDSLDLGWGAIDEAAGYWLEVALDVAFKQIVLSRWGLQETAFEATELASGLYYWRVMALDRFGLPGARSDVWRFAIQSDANQPYLMILEPEDRAIIRSLPITVRGETEPTTRLTLNGRPLSVASDGSFERDFQLRRGVNELTVIAKDQAGNVTQRVRSVIFTPDETAVVRYDSAMPRFGHNDFGTQDEVFSLAGRTISNSRIDVVSEAGETRASGYSDAAGRFLVNLQINEASESFRLLVTAPSGFVTRDEFTVRVDREPPLIQLDEPPPPATAVDQLTLSGRVVGGVELRVNGRSASLEDERFESVIDLQTGRNEIEMEGRDQIGNLSVERWQIYLDQDPPELIGHSLSQRRASGGERITVEVRAEDRSGMKQAATVTIKVGDFATTGFLKLNRASKSYRGVVALPQGARGRIVLTSVELEDYVGNRRRYVLE